MKAVMINHLTAFLGPIGGPEMMMVFLVLLAIPVVAVVLTLKYVSSRTAGSQSSKESAQTRLSELENLRSQNLISDEEYAEKRKQIINDL